MGYIEAEVIRLFLNSNANLNTQLQSQKLIQLNDPNIVFTLLTHSNPWTVPSHIYQTSESGIP